MQGIFMKTKSYWCSYDCQQYHNEQLPTDICNELQCTIYGSMIKGTKSCGSREAQ